MTNTPNTSSAVVAAKASGAGASAPAPRGTDVHKLVAGQIMAAMVSRGTLSSMRAMVRDGDMGDSNIAAKLAGMVCDACERA